MSEVLKTSTRVYFSTQNQWNNGVYVKSATPLPQYYEIKNSIIVQDISDVVKYETSRTLQDNDVVYFTSLSSVPRSKFSTYINEIAKERNITRTRDIKNATVVVIGKLEAKRAISRSAYVDQYYRIEKSTFENIIQSKCPHSTHDVIYVHKKVTSQIKGVAHLQPILTYPTVQIADRLSDAEQIKLLGIYEVIDDIRERMKNGLRMVEDNSILETISNQGMALDEETIKGIDNMLGSKNPDDVTMGMMMLTNCAYRENVFEIASLLNKHQVSIRTSISKNLVAFKALCTFFNDITWMANPRQFMVSLNKYLIKNNLATEDTHNKVVSFMLDSYNKESEKNNRGFEIKEIELTDSFVKTLNQTKEEIYDEEEPE